MLRRFHWLRLDEKHSLESLLASIVACCSQEPAQVFDLTLHVSVKKRHISLATSPKNVVFAIQGDRSIECVLNLSGGTSQHVKIGVRRRTIHIPRIRKYVCS